MYSFASVILAFVLGVLVGVFGLALCAMKYGK